MSGINSKEFRELKSPGYNLYMGSGDNESVKALQKQLNKWGYTDGYDRPLSEDGIYGKNTYNAVIKYQRDNGLAEDGVAGDKTWNSMSDRMEKEEEKQISSASVVKETAPKENLSSAKVASKSTKPEKNGIKFPIIPAFYEYLRLKKSLPDKVESDGEVQNAYKRMEEAEEGGQLLEPAGNFMNEEEAEEAVGEMAAWTLGYFQ